MSSFAVLRCLQNGRIKGEQKKALRAVIERYELPVTLTPHQNIILRDVDPAWQADISATLAAVGLGDWNTWDSLDRWGQAGSVHAVLYDVDDVYDETDLMTA